MDNSTVNGDMNNSPKLRKINQLVIDGKPIFGVFDRVEQINYLDYRSFKLSGKPVSKWRKKLRANQFCFVQVVQPPYRVCVAVATLNWVTSSFCYIYNSNTDEIEVIEALQPLTCKTTFNQSTYHEHIEFNSRKLAVRMDFSNETLLLSINSKILNLSAKMQRQSNPLAVCTSTGKTGWTYTQKEPMTQMSGLIEIMRKEGSTHIDLTGATATLDWSVGYLRRITNWWWACITGFLADGRHLGLNLATGVNESGASENAVWVDGVRYHLPTVLFEREIKKNGKEVWHIHHQSLSWSKIKIDLTFTPITCYKKNDRLLVVDSIFEQWVGYYSGTIELPKEVGFNNIIIINNLMGLAEDHYAKW